MTSEYKQQVIDFFARRIAYDDEGDSHPNQAQLLLEYVTIESGQRILDLATGTGLVAVAAAEKVAPDGSVVGVDISSVMLAQAKSKIAARRITNLKLIKADIEVVEFAPEFDIIFCCSALVYISDIPAILNKCHSWLKPGGCLAFTTPDKTSNLAKVRVDVCRKLFKIELPHIIRPLCTLEKCRSLLQKSGFKNIELARNQYSRVKIDNNYASTRLEREFYPRGNPLAKLSAAQLNLLQAEYTKAVEQLIAQQGEWIENQSLFVKANK